MSNRWYVHLQGPDELEPADGMLDAMQKAALINSANVAYLENRGRPVSQYMPLVWAIPIMPGDETTAHITDDEETSNDA